MDRAPGLSVRLKLTLSYAGFLMVAGGLLLAAVWLFLLRYVPDRAFLLNADTHLHGPFPVRSSLLHVFAPDLASFSDFALKTLLRMPGVKGTRSSFIMQAIKSDLAWAPAPRLK